MKTEQVISFMMEYHKVESEEAISLLKWWTHIPLLYWALEKTKNSKKPIIEFGCGEGSTPFLQYYCKKNSRKLISYDENSEWASRYNAIHIANWDSIIHEEYSVALIDHSPAGRRHIDALLIKDKSDYIVIHDSEVEGNQTYMFDKIWGSFQYKKDIRYNHHNQQRYGDNHPFSPFSPMASIVSTKYELPNINPF